MKMDEGFGDYGTENEMVDMHHHGEKKKKMMTMDDVSECLQKDFSEEMEDAKKYLCMAKIADGAGDHHDSHYLLEMAKDEYTHACFIRSFMKHHEMEIPLAHEKRYKELEEEMAEFFQT